MIETSPPSTLVPIELKDPFLKVDALLQSDIPSTSSCDRNSLSALKTYLSQVEQMYNEFMATYCEIFDKVSGPDVKKLFGSNAEKLLKFKVMKQSLSGKIRSTQTKIKQLNKSNESTDLNLIPWEMANMHQNASIEISNDGLTGEFDGYDFEHSNRMKTSLKRTFGLDDFRPNQLQAINATLLGYDTFILLPTGGGKSLCYQLPATLTKSVSIIVSPLKSLIMDQIDKLKTCEHLTAINLSGNMTKQQFDDICDQMECEPPKISIVYTTPEKILKSERLQETLKKLYVRNKIARIVIDEVHCIRYRI